MNSIPRYELICFVSDDSFGPIEDIPGDYAKQFVGVENYTSTTGYFTREDDIYLSLEMVAFRHLEFPGAEDADPWIQNGFDCALHYFLDDWKTDQDPEGYNMVVAKRQRDSHIAWYRGYSRGLILGLLSERWDDVTRFCNWPWANLVPEYAGMGGDLENEVAQMYIVVAASLRDEPMEGLEKLKGKIRKCRTKRPRLLMQLWETVESEDQSAFDKALNQSLRHHASGKRLDNRDQKIAERLALPQTAIGLAAMRRGLRLPDLPEELSAYLITRRSLDLDT